MWRVLKIIAAIVIGTALFIAVCRLFNYDPFGIIGWVLNTLGYIISRLADLIYNCTFFRKLFGK